MKRIVVDFDDTLSFCTNRDWDNATPNTELIAKLNKLATSGWIIDVFTARGSLSCSTRQEADDKYRIQIETWLQRHSVNYSSLSFDKPLAAWYIDDKAVTPESFISDVHIEQMTGGLSGADVYSEGTYVYKTSDDSKSVVQWYQIASEAMLPVPEVKSLIGNTIKMEKIQGIHIVEAINKYGVYRVMGIVAQLLQDMSQVQYTGKFEQKVHTYIDRLNHHAKHHSLHIGDIISKCKSVLENNVLIANFAHGDFSESNLIIGSDYSITMIDPLYKPAQFSCTLLDAAKLYATIAISEDVKPQDKLVALNILSGVVRITERELRILAMCELLRTITNGGEKRLEKFLQMIQEKI
jgi:capsule biosynthesis phosphatase